MTRIGYGHKILKIPCPYTHMMPTIPDYCPRILKSSKIVLKT